MKRINAIFMVIVVLLGVMIAGCNLDTAEEAQQKQTEETLKEINTEIGFPNISNFQQKKLMKLIYELCDKEDLVCYAYIKADYSGELVFLGKCIGYGIPFSAQYTNPMKTNGNYHDSTALPQADPNGLYMPTSSSATWLMLIDPKTNEPRPVYIEPEILVSPFKLK